jgi:shikimate dehydrogenase
VKRLAVLGHPVAHSRSPAMQTAALAALGLAGEWSYEAIDVPPADFAELTAGLASEGFVGANITIPHKEAALALADDPSTAAGEIGAANTISFRDGAIRADNTDAPGLLAALPGSPAGKRALVLGAGGSARAAAWALAGGGATVEVWNRTAARAAELVASLAEVAASGGGALAALGSEQAAAGDHDLVVNCTAVGMPGSPASAFDDLPLEPEKLRAGLTVIDLVYAGGETELLRLAREAGATVVDGLEVLVRQGAESLRIWTGEEPPLDVMREAARVPPAGAGG